MPVLADFHWLLEDYSKREYENPLSPMQLEKHATRGQTIDPIPQIHPEVA